MIRIYPKNGKPTDEYIGEAYLQPLSAKVHEEKNGEYSLTLTIDRSDTACENEQILLAPTPKHGVQKFRIVKTMPSMMGEKTVYAKHIFYDLADNYIDDTRPTECTGAQALEKMMAGLQYPQSIVGTSDIQRTSTAYWEMLNPVEALIGTQENSFINRWGGLLDRDNEKFTISDNSLTPIDVIYGKNLDACGLVLDFESVVTRIIPTGLQSDGISLLKLPELCVDSPKIGEYIQPKIRRIHYQNIRVGTNEGDYATEEEVFNALRAAANAEFASGIDLPTASGTVSIVDLKQMEEYKNVKGLTEIVPFAPIRVWLNTGSIEAEMQAYDYDALAEQFESITIGIPEEYAGQKMQKSINQIGERLKNVENILKI